MIQPSAPEIPAAPKKPSPEILPTPQKDTSSAPSCFDAKEVFRPDVEVMPIDLPTALRLADASNPAIALARQRVEEAYARLQQAQLLWVPDLVANPGYLRHDGEIQNSTGVVFNTNKSSAFAVGGASLVVDSGNALFGPLIARRLVDAQAAASRAVNNNIQLDVALAYLDLLQQYAQLAVNADLLARDQEIFRRARQADAAELSKTGADLNRAHTELLLRKQDRIAIAGQVRLASSRLARLLLLRPSVALVPAEPSVVPITLVAEDSSIDQLVSVGLQTRPELAESRALVAASVARLRQAEWGPLLPSLDVAYTSGVFGGGINSDMSNFHARGDGTAEAVWTLRNFGLGNLALNRERRAQVGEANAHVLEVQAQVGDEVNEAAQVARARREVLNLAQETIQQAVEVYRKLDVISFGMTGVDKTIDTVQPLLAVQALAQARTNYLAAVIDYNRAQFQLYTAMGRPAVDALPKASAQPVEVPVAPPTFRPTRQ
jgi:outer membrane protein TolC